MTQGCNAVRCRTANWEIASIPSHGHDTLSPGCILTGLDSSIIAGPMYYSANTGVIKGIF